MSEQETDEEMMARYYADAKKLGWTDEELDLDGALCNFVNGASDEWNPKEWAEETRANFAALCKAYNAWYASKAKVW